MIGNSVGLDR